MKRFLALGLLVLCIPAQAQHYDVLIEGGTVYDGTGSECQLVDIGIRADQIVAIGNLKADTADLKLNVEGLAVAPGFINMLSWATTSLLIDGRSFGDIHQGVTLEVLGEGMSMGPLTPAMKENLRRQQTETYSYEIPWTSLGEYLEHMVAKGVSPNVASFVGATTIRVHVLGYENRPPSDAELEEMRTLVRQAMEEGAVGLSSALIYAPAFYADTDELTALAKIAAEYDGMYISHMRSEGARLLESVDELVQIARDSGARAEIYHLKIAGKENWHKYDALIEKISSAQDEGLAITADMYTYTAGSTGLDAAMPPWVQEGGYEAWRARLKDPDIRARLAKEMITPTDQWENLLLSAGPEKTLLVGFHNPDLREYAGMTLAQVASARGQSAVETAMDLVIEDGSRVQVVYFLMSEENLDKMIQLPYVSFGSDAASMSASGVFLERSTHPRAYGNFARVLGTYVREKKLLTLPEAVHKLTGLPAHNLRLKNRGLIKEGYFADIAIFDPKTVRDRATYDDPHQLSEGMHHVLVNGEAVLLNGEHTGALPGRVVRGPGYRPAAKKLLP